MELGQLCAVVGYPRFCRLSERNPHSAGIKDCKDMGSPSGWGAMSKDWYAHLGSRALSLALQCSHSADQLKWAPVVLQISELHIAEANKKAKVTVALLLWHWGPPAQRDPIVDIGLYTRYQEWNLATLSPRDRKTKICAGLCSCTGSLIFKWNQPQEHFAPHRLCGLIFILRWVGQRVPASAHTLELNKCRAPSTGYWAAKLIQWCFN